MVSELLDQQSAGLGQNISPTFGYYRQPNGWITVSPNTRMERLKYTEEGWEYLEEYGAFDMTPYTANHPLEGLFMFGGAKEMSADQIIQTGLYIDPPLVPTCRQHLTQYHRAHRAGCWRGAKKVEFPQLATVSSELIGPFICDFCQRKMPTVAAREQHQSVAHREPLGNIRLGQSLGDTLGGILAKVQAPSVIPDTPSMKEQKLMLKIAELEGEQQKLQTKRVQMAKARAAKRPARVKQSTSPS